MATKTELEQAHNDCSFIYSGSYKLLKGHHYLDACKTAMCSLPKQFGSMSYQKRYLRESQLKCPNITAVLLRYAPLYFQRTMLTTMESWYTKGTKGERSLLPDFPALLKQAWAVMKEAALCWQSMVNGKFAFHLQSLAQREALSAWATSGLIAQADQSGSDYQLVTRVDRIESAKCSRCGTVSQLKLRECLSLRKCAVCKNIAEFIIGQTGVDPC